MGCEKIFEAEFTRLFKEVQEKDEFELVNILLGYKGMGDPRALTHFHESENLFQDLNGLITNDPAKNNNVRIGLFLYCHFFEMGELYRILGNLLYILKGERYNFGLFEENEGDELYPDMKIEKLKTIADKEGFGELISIIGDLYYNRIRNSFFHSNYSIIEDDYIIVSNKPVVINGVPYNVISIKDFLFPIILSTLKIADIFFTTLKKYKLSFQNNKIINGRFPEWQPIIVLGNKEAGLIGFETFQGSSIRLTSISGQLFLAAYNIRINTGKKQSLLEKELIRLIDKNNYSRNDPKVKDIERAIVTGRETNLLVGLANLFYNWGNNIVSATQKAITSQQKEAQYLIAMEKYEKSLLYDKGLAEAIHNKATTKLRLIEISDKNEFQKKDILEEILTSLKLKPDMDFAHENAERLLFSMGKEEKDKVQAEKFFLEAIIHNKIVLEKNPSNCDYIFNGALCLWELAKLYEIEMAREQYQNAHNYFLKLFKCDNTKTEHYLGFTSFLEIYAKVYDDLKMQLLKEAISLLNNIIGNEPDNYIAIYKRANKFMLIGLGEPDNEQDLLSAIKDYRLSLSFFDKDDKCLNNLGFALSRLGSLYTNDKSKSLYFEAIKYLNEALKVKSEKPESYINLGNVYFLLFQMEKDIKFIQLSISNYEKADLLTVEVATYELMTAYSVLENKENTIKYFKILKNSDRYDVNKIIDDPNLIFLKNLSEFDH